MSSASCGERDQWRIFLPPQHAQVVVDAPAGPQFVLGGVPDLVVGGGILELPQREVEISISDEERAAIDNPSINKEIFGQTILQVGSFQSAREADSLKAQLALLGLEASVKSALVNDDTWHRVQLGPFGSETNLSRAKNLLIENSITYMQRSMP